MSNTHLDLDYVTEILNSLSPRQNGLAQSSLNQALKEIIRLMFCCFVFLFLISSKIILYYSTSYVISVGECQKYRKTSNYSRRMGRLLSMNKSQSQCLFSHLISLALPDMIRFILQEDKFWQCDNILKGGDWCTKN